MQRTLVNNTREGRIKKLLFLESVACLMWDEIVTHTHMLTSATPRRDFLLCLFVCPSVRMAVKPAQPTQPDVFHSTLRSKLASFVRIHGSIFFFHPLLPQIKSNKKYIKKTERERERRAEEVISDGVKKKSILPPFFPLSYMERKIWAHEISHT